MDNAPGLQQHINAFLIAKLGDTNDGVCSFLGRQINWCRVEAHDINAVWYELCSWQMKVVLNEIALCACTEHNDDSTYLLQQGTQVPDNESACALNAI